VILLWIILAGSARAILPLEYRQMFGELSAMADGTQLTPGQIMNGSWMCIQYFAPADERLEFNRAQFMSAVSPGRAAVSGLFLAIHGDPRARLALRSELETNRLKREWIWMNLGTEEVFFRNLLEGAKYQPLTRALPSVDGLRIQIRILMNSKDALVRRAGLFWGSWLADDGYRWGAGQMAESDADPVNRACAGRLLAMLR
jgi:hypothetical protein